MARAFNVKALPGYGGYGCKRFGPFSRVPMLCIDNVNLCLINEVTFAAARNGLVSIAAFVQAHCRRVRKVKRSFCIDLGANITSTCFGVPLSPTRHASKTQTHNPARKPQRFLSPLLFHNRPQ